MEWVTIITGIATVALAITAWKAFRSNQSLIATARDQLEVSRAQMADSRAQLELAQEALVRQQEPRLVPADPDLNYLGGPIETRSGPQIIARTRRVLIGVENAGLGIALGVKAEAQSNERGTLVVWCPPTIPAGAVRHLKLTPHGGSVDPAGETVTLRLDYTGAGGEERQLRFTAQRFPGNDWRVDVTG